MKNLNFIKKTLFFALIAMNIIGCQNEDADLTEAKYSNNPNVFLDTFVGMNGDDFILFYGGSNFGSFSVDTNTGYESQASIRIDVPNANDLNGNYAGAILRVMGEGRDLTEYNALTFWVKASQGVTIGEFGFGEDFIDNKYITTLTNVSVGTAWKKVIIPIPDPSKLTKERGLFRYSAGTQGTGGNGYVFWIDEIKFEKLGTVAHPQATINYGNNTTQDLFVGVTSQVSGIQTVFNMPNGINMSVVASPYYFNFVSSNPAVATVSGSGLVTAVGQGSATITATFNGVNATGSLNINCVGIFVHAPTPTHLQQNVISIFSNAYNNVPVNYYNGYWAPWQTTISNDFTVLGDNILKYEIFNFVGMEFSSPTINATLMTHFHLDCFIPGTIAPGRQLRVIVVDFGADGIYGGGDDTRHSTTFTAPTLVSQNWISINIPFASMPGLLSKSHLAQIILEGGDGSVIYVDNVYFYKL